MPRNDDPADPPVLVPRNPPVVDNRSDPRPVPLSRHAAGVLPLVPVWPVERRNPPPDPLGTERGVPVRERRSGGQLATRTNTRYRLPVSMTDVFTSNSSPAIFRIWVTRLTGWPLSSSALIISYQFPG